MVRKHAKFCEDRTIGGAITVKKIVSFVLVQARNYGKSCKIHGKSYWNMVNNEDHTEMWCIMVKWLNACYIILYVF